MTRPTDLGWRSLPRTSRVFVSAVLIAGAMVLVTSVPFGLPHPGMLGALLLASCLMSAWKVNLPIPLASGSTLSVSYAANLTALILLGPQPAILVAVAGAWTQCTFNVRQRYPAYRTAFSVAAEAITMWATAAVYVRLDGALAAQSFEVLARPLVGAIATYFIVNTSLVAYAIASSTGRSFWRVWQIDFLWSGASFAVAGTAGAVAAVVMARGGQWKALLMMAPVYLIFRTYETVIGRLDDQRRHLDETKRLHEEAIDALAQARRAERALTDEKERLSVTLRSIADGVIATDTEGTIVLINSVAENMTGWAREAVVGQPLANVFRNMDPQTRRPCDNSVAALTSPARPRTLRCSLLVARDLTERPIEESAAAVHDDQGNMIGMVLAFRDITNTLKIQEERAKANRLSALGQLAGGMGHDFNNILMAIMGNVSLARTATPRGQAADALTEAELACLRARQLTWQLLTFSKGGVPSRKPMRLAAVVQEAVDTALRGSRVSYTLDVPPELWTVDADGGQLIQAFTEILTNAHEAMPQGGTVAIRLENVVAPDHTAHDRHSAAPQRYVTVSVSDEGIGIRREHMPRIFDPYFSTKPQASGIGLATIQSIVKNHDGFVTVDSEPGLGTTVRVSLPAADCTVPVVRATDAVCRKGRVLVIDEEAGARKLAANMLDFLGFEPEAAESARNAVERFTAALRQRRPFDVVMLGLGVTGLQASDTIKRLAQLDPAVKFVLVSGEPEETVMSDRRHETGGAVISKPFTLQDLNATLNSVLTAGTYQVH
jgi:PAS domain S-box-containing protein